MAAGTLAVDNGSRTMRETADAGKFLAVGLTNVDDDGLRLERCGRCLCLFAICRPCYRGQLYCEPAHQVGNGPFVLSEWRPQQRIVVRRNPRYHHAGAVRLDEIQFIRFDDRDAEERSYRAGQLDVTIAVPEAKLDSYARDRPAELHRAPLAETRFLAFNVQRPPLSDPRVRHALSLALDRNELVTRVLRGGQEPADYFLSPALLRHGGAGSGPVPPGTGNPAEARRLLAEAGFPAGRGFPRLKALTEDRFFRRGRGPPRTWRRQWPLPTMSATTFAACP